jgi:hypothetical protein
MLVFLASEAITFVKHLPTGEGICTLYVSRISGSGSHPDRHDAAKRKLLAGDAVLSTAGSPAPATRPLARNWIGDGKSAFRT